MLRTALWTALALIAFSANSLLCRLALSRGSIDPASFTTVRLASGALTLAILARAVARPPRRLDVSWASAAMLFLYAAPFSFAYSRLTAGTGALLVFGAVQVTMILGSLRAGDRPNVTQWLGLLIAFGGLVYLVLPGLTAPHPVGAALMLVAGLAWGLYSLRGRSARDPLAQTASNFARTVPMTLALSVASYRGLHVESTGLALAALSGAVASGVGYVIWYHAVPGLPGIAASIVQLPVPVLTTAGGVLLLHERITLRLGLAALLVLGGVAVTLLARSRGLTRERLSSG
ncbi:MAG TPA: DMT family transporter [Gemmatimonadales bacterium]|nr:DMT family transporter [Gemmatimonadales bacterium]